MTDKTDRDKLILLLALIVFQFLGCARSDTADQSPPPNIVLIMTDDQGWAQLGWRGNEVIQTPNLDRFASQSVDFTRFYASPVCSPTRASLMTGRYNYRTGVVEAYLGRSMMHTDEVTLAEMLREAGYRTGIFGKWHLGDNYPMRPQDQGFDEVLIHGGGGIGRPSDPEGNSYFDPFLRHNGDIEKYTGYCTDIFVAAATEFVEEKANRPFFAYIPTNAPHDPYLVADSYIEPYKAQGLSDQDARIYGMITNIDENIGRFLERLEQLGIAENTIVIFMSDNGPTTEHFTAGLRGQKKAVYEGGIRVPFFFRWPEKVKPAKVDRPVAHIDVVPTLLEAVGVSKPANVEIDGVSLVPLILSVAAKIPETQTVSLPDRTIYLQAHRSDKPEIYRNFAAISERYKLVQPRDFTDPMPADPEFELYDIEADPEETKNIAAQQPKIVATLKSGYERWFRDVSSTRGYEPPPIQVGTPHENPTTLTRQDWRVVGPAGWSDSHLGYWQIEVPSQGSYKIRFRFASQETPGHAEFEFGTVEARKAFARLAETVTFGPMALEPGPGLLKARLVRGGQTVGVRYVDVTRLE